MDEDGVTGGVENLPVILLAATQLVKQLLLHRHIKHDPEQTHRAIIFNDDGNQIVNPDNPSVGSSHAIFEVVVLMFFGHHPAVSLGLRQVVLMRFMFPEISIRIPIMDRITEEVFRLPADEQEPERGVFHLPDDPVDGIDQVAKSLFIGNNRFFADFNGMGHARNLVGQGIYFRKTGRTKSKFVMTTGNLPGTMTKKGQGLDQATDI